LNVSRCFLYYTCIFISILPYASNAEDPDELLRREIFESGKFFFKEADKETNEKFLDPEILNKCAAYEEAALKASGNSVKNKEFFNYFRAPGVWEKIFEGFKPAIKSYPQSKRYRVQLFKFAVYADRVDELWSWLRNERLE
jgi:hypothetical protein